jgi:uncharacterized protein (DUF983 family)
MSIAVAQSGTGSMSTPRPGPAPLDHVNSDPAVRAKTRPHIWAALARGLRRRCPACGGSALFEGYLTLTTTCPACGLDTQRYRADDAPAYFTIAIVGHIVVPLLLMIERLYAPSTLVQLGIWVPVTLALTLWILPRAKGALVATNWATGAGG